MEKCKVKPWASLKDGILKENIDGEALIWASNRLKRRTEKKKNIDCDFRWSPS